MTSSEIVYDDISALPMKYISELDEPKYLIASAKLGDNLCPDTEPNTKCGEILLEYNQKFILVCILCTNNFETLEDFGNHVRSEHLNPKTYTEQCPLVEESFQEANSDGEVSQDSKDDIYSVELEFLKDEDCVDLEVLNEKEFETLSDGDMEANQGDQELETLSDDDQPSDGDAAPNQDDQNLETLSDDEQPSDEEMDQHQDDQDLDEGANESLASLKLEKMFSCTLCNAKYRHKRSYFAHARKEHGILTKRMKDKLEKKANEVLQKEGDSDSAGSGQIFSCNSCSKIYRHKRSLRFHVLAVHGYKCLSPIPNETQCRYCGEGFEGREELETHMDEKHSGDKKYPCPFCDRYFSTPNGRQTHIYNHTGERPYKCPHCSKAFSVSSNLKKHIDAHLKIKKYSCQFCGKLFVQSTERNIHEQRHTGDKPFQCEECGKRFLTHTQLLHHHRRHQNIRKFKCEVCDKAFFTSTALKEHMAGHSEARPFECTECGQCFPRRKSLRQHANLHSKVKKYVCNTCGKAFAQCAGLYSHRKTHGEIVK